MISQWSSGVSFCAQTLTLRRVFAPLVYDWLEFVVICDGTYLLRHRDNDRRDLAKPGDVLVLQPNPPCGLEPEGQVTVTRMFARWSLWSTPSSSPTRSTPSMT